MGRAADQAIAEWRSQLGEAAVLDAVAAQSAYGASTIGAHRQLVGALRVSDESQLPALLRTANTHGAPLYPISTGHNWGYGSALPVTDGCFILDLSALNHIHSLDPDTGVVSLGPGVTQGQLSRYLLDRGLPYMVPVTGAGPSCSVLANALERGYGITPVADHFAAVTSITAYLADGSCYRSPLAEMGCPQVDGYYKWGVGPYLDGLFSQGGFGVVTRMTITLARRPEAIESFFFRLGSDGDVSQAAAVLRELKRELPGVLGAVNLMNDRRMLAMVERYPEGGAAGEILAQQQVDALAGPRGIRAWTGAGALYGHPEVVAAARRHVQRRLAGIAGRVLVLNSRRLALAQRLAAWLPGARGAALRASVATLASAYEVLRGVPNEVALPLAYWRAGGPPEGQQGLDPARDGCGLYWYAPLLPMEAAAVERFRAMVAEICPRFGMEPLVTLTTLSEHCFDATVPLLFDRRNDAQRAAARACWQALVEEGIGCGFAPYRLNIDAMADMGARIPVYWQTVGRLKASLDPSGVIAPGRYSPAPGP